jgi:Fanconi anemia group M protein
MPEIVIDHREMRSPVAKTLERLGVKLTFKTFLVGDHVVSDRIALERKTMDDLFSSWLDEKKLFEQLYDLAQAYHRPVLIIEGSDPCFTTRRVKCPGNKRYAKRYNRQSSCANTIFAYRS